MSEYDYDQQEGYFTTTTPYHIGYHDGYKRGLSAGFFWAVFIALAVFGIYWLNVNEFKIDGGWAAQPTAISQQEHIRSNNGLQV